jgi:hypothetical protein
MLEQSSPLQARYVWTRSEWSILAIALVMRILWGVAIPLVPTSDSRAYDKLARNLAAGYGYGFEPGHPSAYWPVGTSAVCSLLYRVFGLVSWPIVVMNILAGLAIVALTMRLSARWYGPLAGRLSGLLLAFWPGQIEFTTILASELWFNACYLIWLWIVTREKPDWGLRSLIGGLALAAASYIRPVSLLLPVVLAFVRIVGNRDGDWRSRSGLMRLVGETSLTVGVMLLAILPWSIRNQEAFGKFVLISTNGGPNLWMGNNPKTTGSYMPLPPEVESMDEISREAWLKQEALAYIRAKPVAFLSRTASKLLKLHDRETIGVVWNESGLETVGLSQAVGPLKLISTVYWWIVLLLAGIGVVSLAWDQRIVGLMGDPAVVIWLYFTLLHAIIVSGDRYHFPSVPMIAALAGFSMTKSLLKSRTSVASRS